MEITSICLFRYLDQSCKSNQRSTRTLRINHYRPSFSLLSRLLLFYVHRPLANMEADSSNLYDLDEIEAVDELDKVRL